MKRALMLLIAGTVLSGLAAAYASTIRHSPTAADTGENPRRHDPQAKRVATR